MAEPLLGIAASAVLYVSGNLLWLALLRLAWSRQPTTTHPEIEAARDEAASARLRWIFRPPSRRALPWLCCAVIVFAVLWATDFPLLFMTLYVAVLAAWWTQAYTVRARSQNREWRDRVGLQPAFGRRALAAVSGLMYAAVYLAATGILGATCFLSALIVEGLA